MAGVIVTRSHWSWLRQASRTFHKSPGRLRGWRRLSQGGFPFLAPVLFLLPTAFFFPCFNLSSTQTTGLLTLPAARLVSSRPRTRLLPTRTPFGPRRNLQGGPRFDRRERGRKHERHERGTEAQKNTQVLPPPSDSSKPSKASFQNYYKTISKLLLLLQLLHSWRFRIKKVNTSHERPRRPPGDTAQDYKLGNKTCRHAGWLADTTGSIPGATNSR